MEPRRDRGDSIVVDNPEELRYELWLGEELAGEIRYIREDDGTVVLVHTEIEPRYEHQGLGNVLVRERVASTFDLSSRAGQPSTSSRLRRTSAS